MLTAEQNELLTRIATRHADGQAHAALLAADRAPPSSWKTRWTKRVRLLGEDLVLFRDRQGRLGLIAEHCPHRRASLAHGIPTDDGIRCPYHGWEFGAQGDA